MTTDVSNLWRLEAQRGVFLFTNWNWDIDYPMDRIVFPYTGYPSAPTRDRIYPAHKSHLEQALDQYFDLERSTFGHFEMTKMMEQTGTQIGHWETFPDGISDRQLVLFNPFELRTFGLP